jgi:transposase
MGKSIENLNSVTQVGLDLTKTVFQVRRRQGRSGGRAQGVGKGLIEFFGKLPPCLVAKVACSSPHHWARALIGLGHEVRRRCGLANASFRCDGSRTRPS